MKEILVVVDMQNDFLTGALKNHNAAQVIQSVAEEIAIFQNKRCEIVYTRDTHGADYLSTQEGKRLPIPHCIEHTAGWEIFPALLTSGSKIFDKRYFGSLELAKYIESGGYESAELVGVCTDICILANAVLIKTVAPECHVCVKEKACAGVSQISHETAIAAMRGMQIDII